MTMMTSGLQVVADIIQEGKGAVRWTGSMGDNLLVIEMVVGITRNQDATTNGGQNVTLETMTNDDANGNGKEIGSAMTAEAQEKGSMRHREGSVAPLLLVLAPQSPKRLVHVPVL
jgi:hypothetical protein